MRRQIDVLEHRQLHVLQHRQSGKQRPLLEGDPVVRLDQAQLRRRHLRDVLTLDADHAGLRALQSQNAPEQHRLARARAADDAEHLVFIDLHVQAVVHQLGAEAVDQSANLQDRVPHMSSSMNSTANAASARMTRKIAWTTATVVSRPSSREEPRTCMPR